MYIILSFHRLYPKHFPVLFQEFLPVLLVCICLALYTERGKQLAASSSFDSCLLTFCKNPLKGAFEVILNRNHHPEEEVSCEPSQEEGKASEVKHLNQYRFHSCRYLVRPSKFCGCCLQVGYQWMKISIFLGPPPQNILWLLQVGCNYMKLKYCVYCLEFRTQVRNNNNFLEYVRELCRRIHLGKNKVHGGG